MCNSTINLFDFYETRLEINEMENSFACVKFLDDKLKYYYLPINTIYYNQNDQNTIRPKDFLDFEQNHKYFIEWKNNEDSESEIEKICKYPGYILCLGGSKEEVQYMVSNKPKRYIFKKKFTSNSEAEEEEEDANKVSKPQKIRLCKTLNQKVNSERILLKYKQGILINNRNRSNLEFKENNNIKNNELNIKEVSINLIDVKQSTKSKKELDILKNNYEYLSTYKRKLYKMYEREKFDLTSEFEEHTEIYRNVGNKIGIIGGTGLNDPSNKILKSRSEIKQEDAKNEFGLPSSNIYEGTINGVDVALLSRHGTNHTITPTNVNYRANIEALRLVGCTHILACTASGSLSESIDRGQLVIPDSYINRTIHRKGTFYDGTSKTYSGTCHVPMEPAFDPRTSQILETAASKLNIPIRKGGTIVTIEGPAFSSKAESKMFRLCGAHLINMTTCPEVSLAKEAGLLYAVVAIATDYDCWRDGEDVLSTVDIIELLKKNIDKVVKILIEAVELINQESWDEYIDDLKNLLVSCNVSHV